ncbi:MAG: DEAD/DEAH box helicase [Candidatus Nanoarchaeia archaeon]
MLIDFAPRPYQTELFKKISSQNSLLVLPTGLGKTAIAMMFAAKRLLQYPGKKIVFLAPTKPLVEQQYNSFKKQFRRPAQDFGLCTGGVSPQQRKKIWGQSTFIFSTPQTLENDILSSRY